MKLFIYCRPRDYTTREALDLFHGWLAESGLPFVVNREYVEHVHRLIGLRLPSYDRLTPGDLDGGAMMVSIGGDGTFLNAVHHLGGLPMPIVGVNAGRLGFLASIRPRDFAEALTAIKSGQYTVRRRSMLAVEGDFGVQPEFPCALNEFTIHRHTADMIEVRVWADGHLLPVVRGDGYIISTPTGSTAYSLSAGGPLVAPECSCFVLSAIAPHNFTIRPLVLPEWFSIELEVRSRGGEVMASLDNNGFIVGDRARFTVKKSNSDTFLAQIQNISFYDTLREKIMWGLDSRDSVAEKN